ncbi:MAG TPA: type II toxin-antitoxin system YoeB family toxin [Gordonibacter urolithinfaciens]|uniref:type II toxin-antitoxin system YoeB family toxin n=1 Tax=Gordonibacter urolithinfaciens TaxID=1335613 RepID=UPI001D94D34B|nr:type II toxin-antitoxin system YoeB family toxin [Gordonibacter urolithinfaciens]
MTAGSEAWADRRSWKSQDEDIRRLVKTLVASIESDGAGAGVGVPRPLKTGEKSLWTRRIADDTSWCTAWTATTCRSWCAEATPTPRCSRRRILPSTLRLGGCIKSPRTQARHRTAP